MSVLLVTFVGGGVAWAEPAHDPSVLRRFVGRTIVVHDSTDRPLAGALQEVRLDSLVLAVDGGTRVVGLETVGRVGVVGDSIWDGVLKGLGVGALLTLLGNADVGCDTPCFANSAASQALGVGLVGAIGGWIDARHTRERIVYEKAVTIGTVPRRR